MKKLLAFLMAAIMIVALAVPVLADNTNFDYETNGTEADGTSTKLHKYLVVEKDTSSPAITFQYTIAPGTAVPAAEGTLPVYAGIGEPSVADVAFAAGDASTPGATGQPITDDTKLFGTKDIVIDFDGISFPKPGVYRYILTEKNSNPQGLGGVLYDVDIPDGTEQSRIRTIDVYVQDTEVEVPATSESWTYDGTDYDTYEEAVEAAEAAGGTAEDVVHNPAKAAGSELAILGYVSYMGTVTGSPAQEYDPNGPAADGYANGSTAADATGITVKSNQYINQIKTNTMTVEKVIAGNQGDKESTWKIKVDFTIPEGVTATIKYAQIKDQGQDVEPTYQDYTSGTEITGFGHKDKFKFIGIPEGTKYKVTETDENTNGYITTYENREYTFIKDISVEDKDDSVVTNTRTGVIPTGVAIGIIGGIAIVVLAGGYFFIRRRLATR